ncbi:hypothetical protein N0B31_07270 [Salinirubellus salinus]|uniref:Uncharacterized protein n=1 Tax=Salinirubellus salinus TaxID=1364945 RepID=A0A9E7R688_9EURY|nr:hypothetical protein [Salinirubellus salinus]UWM56083.1 hypothetical protein N0B31_07270 [Salinirubellus salinus]
MTGDDSPYERAVSRSGSKVDRGPDAFGVSIAIGVGVVVGLALGLPALPSGTVAVGGFDVDAVGAVLLASVLSVLVVPLGTYVLYQLFFFADR